MAKPNGKLPAPPVPSLVTPQITRVRDLERPGQVPPSPTLSIKRMTYNVSKFNEDFVPIPTTTTEKIQKFKPDVSRNAWIRRIRSLVPISIWLPEYDWRESLMADIMVGITIAIFQVPQSMGYCLIAHVPPVYGLYSSFFPALFYTILGTGLHCAFGPFALVSGVMTGDIVLQVMDQLGKDPDNTPRLPSDILDINNNFEGLKNIDIAIMVALIIGLYILVFGILQLGFVSNFMSEELISGFCTSAGIIVFVTQLRYLLGVDLSHFSGPFNLIYAIIEVFERLKEVNPYTLAISGICLATLLVFKLGVNRLTLKYCKTPFPIELCVVIGGTVASHFLGLKDKPYNVKIVDTIGNKFPIPLRPVVELFPVMWEKCIATAIVGYTITLSVCKIYGKKHGYKTDANQEMIAMGATNIISGCFQCIPAAASLPRSALQETAGGKTQVVSIVNCCCIVVVILALGSYLEELPICVLGSCIAVALVSIIQKMADFRHFWKVSKLDGMIWIITFLGVLILSVDYGIYLGLLCSLLLLIYKSQRSKIYLLGTVDDLDIYVPINKFNNVEEPKGFKIFQMCGPLNFSNVEYFSSELENKCNINVTFCKKYMKSKEYQMNVEKLTQNSYETIPKLKLIRMALNEGLPKYLVIDCSMFSFIDYSGITTLKKTILQFEEFGVKTVLSGVHVHLESMLAKEGFFTEISTDHLYKSVYDAVITLQEFDQQFKDEETINDNRNDNQLFIKEFRTQMDSNENTFKSESSRMSVKDEDLPDFLRTKFKIPRIYSMTADVTPPLPRVSSSPEFKTRSLPAIHPLNIRAYDYPVVQMGSPGSPQRRSVPNIDYDMTLSTPDSDITEIISMSPDPQPNQSNIPIPPPLPQSWLYSDNNIPKPPPPPPLPSSLIPVAPPLPPQSYMSSQTSTSFVNKPNAKPMTQTKPNSTENDFYEPNEDITESIPERQVKTNPRMSSKLKSRADMLGKVLENHKMSDA